MFTYHLLVENTNKGPIKLPLLLFAPLPLLVFFNCHCWCFSPTVFLITTGLVYLSFVGGKHQQRLHKITTVAVCSLATVSVCSLATVGVFHQQSSSSSQVLFTYHLLVENTNKGSIKLPLLLFAHLPLLVFFNCHCWCFSPTVFLITTCLV
ncbi:MAG: hypothetical protein ACI9SD_000745 [Pseudohongiellaceae bacterium]